MATRCKLLAMLLALALLLPMLFACGGGETPKQTKEKQTKSQDSESGEAAKDWWEDVDFGGETLRINVSVNVNSEQTFGAGDIYSKGPDSLGEAEDNVQKLVFNRNRNVADQLKLNIEWQETDKAVGLSQEVLENFVKLNPDNSPDIFINDVYDLIHAMLNGMLWNLLDRDDGNGNELEYYFDFSNPCWYWEYMAGTTMTPEKVYMVSGDYFFDMIRYAYAIYVNRAMFDDAMQSQCITVHELYEDVLAGYWDYDIMEQYIQIGFRDTKVDGTATKDDEVIGFVVSPHLERTFTYTSGISILQQKDDGEWFIPDANGDMVEYVDRFATFFNTEGIFYQEGAEGVRDCVVLFINNQALFSLSMIGELESEEVRASSVNKGVLPMPKFNQDLQSEYHTLVHDQAEIGCILNNARHFTEATAYLQMVNEQSVDVLKSYYESNLKLRYADDPDTKAMIDLIHGKIGTPFDMIMARLVISGSYLPNAKYTGQDIFNMVLADAKEHKSAFVSSYDSAIEGWRSNLGVLLEIFDNMQ